MGRNSAENQRRYRLKKSQDADWKRKEVIRVQGYYIPTAILPAKKAEKRRERGRKSMAKTRHKGKMQEDSVDKSNDMAAQQMVSYINR